MDNSEFLPLWACKKLIELGCTSQFGKYWEWKAWKEYGEDDATLEDYCSSYYKTCLAFHPWDFVGTSKEAKNNAALLWPKEHRNVVNKLGYEFSFCESCGESCDQDGKWSTASCSETRRRECIEVSNAAEFICSFLKK